MMAEELLKVPLPDPWTFGVTADGRVFFINDDLKETTWLHPVTNQAVTTGYFNKQELPQGWQKGYTTEGGEFYIDHNTNTHTLESPHQDCSIEEPKISSKRRGSFTGSLFRRSNSKTRNSGRKQSSGQNKPMSRRTSFASVTSVRDKSGGKIAMRRDPTAKPMKQGYLYKQNSNGGMWRKRWFLLLSDYTLFYYKDASEKEALASILLPSYSVSPVTKDDKISRKHTFKIEHAGMRTYFISADSKQLMTEWVDALKPVCNMNNVQDADGQHHDDSIKPKVEKDDKKKKTEKKKAKKTKVRTSLTDAERECGFENKTSNAPKSKPNGKTASEKQQTTSQNSSQDTKTRAQKKSVTSSHAQTKQQSRTNKAKSSFSQPTSQHGASRSGQQSTRAQSQNPSANTSQMPATFQPKPLTKQDLIKHQQLQRQAQMDKQAKIRSWMQGRGDHQSAFTPQYPYSTVDGYAQSMIAQPHRFHNNMSTVHRSHNNNVHMYHPQRIVPGSMINVPRHTTHRQHGRRAVARMPQMPQMQKFPESANLTELDSSKVGQMKSSKSHHDIHQMPQFNSVVNLPQSRSEHVSFNGHGAPASHLGTSKVARNSSFVSAVATQKRSNVKVRQIDLKAVNGKKMRAFAISSMISTKNPTHEENSSRQKSYWSSTGNLRSSPSLHSGQTEKIEPKIVVEAKFNARETLESLEDIKFSAEDIYLEMQKLKPKIKEIEQKMETAENESLFDEYSSLQDELSTNKKELVGMAKSLHNHQGSVDAMEKEYRQHKSKTLNAIDSLANENEEEIEVQKIKLQQIDQVLKQIKTAKVNLVNFMEFYRNDRQPSIIENSTPFTSPTASLPSSVSAYDLHSKVESQSKPVNNVSPSRVVIKPKMKHSTSVDNLTADSFFTTNKFSTLSRSDRSKSAFDRLRQGNGVNVNKPNEIKNIQKQIVQNRLKTLTLDRKRSKQPGWVTQQQNGIGTDVHQAIKHNKMPKALKKAKQMKQQSLKNSYKAQSSAKINQSGFDFDDFKESVDNAMGGTSEQSKSSANEGVTMQLPPPPSEDELKAVSVDEVSYTSEDVHQANGDGTEHPFGGVVSSGSGLSSATSGNERDDPPRGGARDSTREDNQSSRSFVDKAKYFSECFNEEQ